jgi:hypothetical protein
MKLQRWVDSLSPVPRLLVWAGISLAVVLLVTLAQVLIGDPTFGWSMGGLFVILMAAFGYSGSVIRNRKHSQG